MTRRRDGDRQQAESDAPPRDGDPRRTAKIALPKRFVIFLAFIIITGVALAVSGLFGSGPAVVLYASQDQVYAEPILKEFERETGIHVRTVFDSEAAKSVAIAMRLLQERSHPKCDVFWGNEEFRTRQLAAAGVFRATNGWASFGYRSRRVALSLVVNVSANVSNPPPPRQLHDLTNAAFRGRVAFAYPMFGTTATHLLALRQHWGESNWLSWCHALAANQPFIVDGNSVSARFVARGEAVAGLTDSDDIAAEIREGAKLGLLPIDSETLLIPNTVGVVRGGPNPEGAERLFRFLQRPQVVARLVAVRALEGVSMAEVTTPTLQPDWDAMLRELEPAMGELQRIFRR